MIVVRDTGPLARGEDALTAHKAIVPFVGTVPAKIQLIPRAMRNRRRHSHWHSVLVVLRHCPQEKLRLPEWEAWQNRLSPELRTLG